jgi:hypothetical protein
MKEAASIKATWLGNEISQEIIQNEIRQLSRSAESKLI